MAAFIPFIPFAVLMCLKYRNAILRNSHSHGLDFLQGLTSMLAYFIAAHKSPEQVFALPIACQ
jgi:hypothetical protein